MDAFSYLLIALGALVAGFVNALAGGGTLISFPILIAAGLPAVTANVTNTVALLPGYLGGTLAQKDDFLAQKDRLKYYLPAAAIGGLLGGLLLLATGEKLFRTLIPYLILMASLLLAVSDPLRKMLQRNMAGRTPSRYAPLYGAVPIGLAAVYGGYFGAGLSVIVLAVLGLTLPDSLTRLNALKQIISFVVNASAALFFVFTGLVVWPVAIVMAVAALLGGMLGGRFASRIKPSTLRWVVVSIGVVVSMVYFIRA